MQPYRQVVKVKTQVIIMNFFLF
jgi:hypothetical protein